MVGSTDGAVRAGARRHRIFISYSHENEKWRRAVAKHLGVLENQGLIDIWDDRKIGAGDDWKDVIHREMSLAKVAVLLISAEFLNSKFILGVEVPELMVRHEADGMTLYPLLVDECAWKAVPWLAAKQLRPQDAKALALASVPVRNKLLASVALEINDICQRADTSKSKPPRAQPPSNREAGTTPKKPRQHVLDGPTSKSSKQPSKALEELASPSPSITKRASKRFKVALSFAGERRSFVEQVAELLQARYGKAAILYDRFHEAEFARPRLAHHLMALYQQQSELIAVVACPNYEQESWTGLEWDTIYDKLVRDRQYDAVMLCRFGRAQMPGALSTDGWCELDEKSPHDLVRLIEERLSLVESKTVARRRGRSGKSSSQRMPSDRRGARSAVQRQVEHAIKGATSPTAKAFLAAFDPPIGSVDDVCRMLETQKASDFLGSFDAAFTRTFRRSGTWASIDKETAMLYEALVILALEQRVCSELQDEARGAVLPVDAGDVALYRIAYALLMDAGLVLERPGVNETPLIENVLSDRPPESFRHRDLYDQAKAEAVTVARMHEFDQTRAEAQSYVQGTVVPDEEARTRLDQYTALRGGAKLILHVDTSQREASGIQSHLQALLSQIGLASFRTRTADEPLPDGLATYVGRMLQDLASRLRQTNPERFDNHSKQSSQ